MRCGIHGFLLMRICAATAVLAAARCGLAVDFTGNAYQDFLHAHSSDLLDPVGDVGLPANAPENTTAGWDIKGIHFSYSYMEDALFVGLAFKSIAGDADDDGEDGSTSAWLAANGGVDRDGLAQTESICVAFDFDSDDQYELIAGVDALGAEHRVAEFVGTPYMPQFAFGADRPENWRERFYDPQDTQRDYEFAVGELSASGLCTGDFVSFSFIAFAGSLEDDGIGEDNLQGELTLYPESLPAVDDLSIRFAPPQILLTWSDVGYGAGYLVYELDYPQEPRSDWRLIAQQQHTRLALVPDQGLNDGRYFRVIAEAHFGGH